MANQSRPKIDPSQLTYEANTRGFMLYYRGKPIGGAGTIRQTGRKSRRMKHLDYQMYRQNAERTIEEIKNGGGWEMFWDNIKEIQGMPPNPQT